MKTIGLLGGMSWESTELYYRLINEETKRQLGGLHSAPIAMVSVDFDKLEKLQHADDWSAMAEMLSKRARQVEVAGADFLLICSNTMHKVADEVAESIDIPLLHLADATARRIVDAGIRTVGLLGTRFTMEHDFYKDILREHGLKVLTYVTIWELDMWMVSTTLKIKSETRVKNGWKGPVFILKNQLILLLLLAPDT